MKKLLSKIDWSHFTFTGKELFIIAVIGLICVGIYVTPVSSLLAIF